MHSLAKSLAKGREAMITREDVRNAKARMAVPNPHPLPEGREESTLLSIITDLTHHIAAAHDDQEPDSLVDIQESAVLLHGGLGDWLEQVDAILDAREKDKSP